ncbi:demethoxyubiquinone hydroxylase family protein [uncultured Fretibacterium sp.]|uniref:demethoxyubiquinone hydroxylase family protein n=1 Tax=uncultured Fretibacterium sp. TaxID=1678694 RepID=UPI00262FAFCB|nr:demethoxyubiquinone hydroxylase family protein [uncultured Fretibacterium sp.]
MPNFPDPFAGNVERKMSREELVQALRIDIAGELEAIFLYDAHAQATDEPLARKVLMEIRDEEKAHVGELTTLLSRLDPNWSESLAGGEGEVLETMQELGIAPADGASDGRNTTVGSLISK